MAISTRRGVSGCSARVRSRNPPRRFLGPGAMPLKPRGTTISAPVVRASASRRRKAAFSRVSAKRMPWDRQASRRSGSRARAAGLGSGSRKSRVSWGEGPAVGVEDGVDGTAIATRLEVIEELGSVDVEDGSGPSPALSMPTAETPLPGKKERRIPPTSYARGHPPQSGEKPPTRFGRMRKVTAIVVQPLRR